jgi:hypothetical protein
MSQSAPITDSDITQVPSSSTSMSSAKTTGKSDNLTVRVSAAENPCVRGS